MASERRFVVSKKEGKVKGRQVITDTETGVQYLFVYDGYAGGLTLLVDKDGKPLVNKDYENSTMQTS